MHGNKCRFFTRYHSDEPHSLATEFDAPFPRLDYVSHDCFDVLWQRHTGEWHRVFEHLSLDRGAASDCERTVFPALLT